jgi:DNA-binding NarL/FixJ family response regulator
VSINAAPALSLYYPKTMQSTASLPSPSAPSVDPPAYVMPLSSREMEVLRLIVDGNTNIQIAAQLYVSPNTIKTHVRSILNKLGVGDRVQAAVFALRHHLV